jgi:prepilin-type N-terminal cleavage/methylation domain-containing protein
MFLENKKNILGFTLVEVMVSIAALTILMLIGNFSFQNSLNSKKLNNEIDNLVSKISEIQTNAITGKGGQNYGIKFNNDSFVSFIGSSYIPTNENNILYLIDSKLEITHDIPGQEGVIVFSKISGEMNHNQNITVVIREKNNPDRSVSVIIGKLGVISIVKTE